MSTVAETTPLPKEMTTFWTSSNNKLLLEKVIYSHVRNQSSKGYEHPTVLSQLCMDSNEWQCVKIHNSAEHCKRHLQSTVEEADLRIPMHVLDCIQAGYKTCVVISNDTDVIIALLYHVPNFLQKGMRELWVRAGRGTTTRFVPLHILHARLGSDLYTVLPALHSLTGCDITSKIGTKKAALKADPKIHLHGFGTTTTLTSATIRRAEQYLVNVVDVGSKCSNFQELREHQFHFSKSLSHQNLPPTSQDPTSIMHSTTHTPLCMSWMRNCTLKQVILIQWITGLHLRMGIFCHQPCGKLWIHVGLWCAIVENALV